MQQRQNTTLNRTRTPERRVQQVPGPISPAGAADVSALRDRVEALEALSAAQAAAISDHEARITALEAQVADHAARISALEP